MGGYGSGNRRQTHRPKKRRTVETSLILSIDSLRASASWKHGQGVYNAVSLRGRRYALGWRIVKHNEGQHMVLEYAVNSNNMREKVIEHIPLETRPQKLGGVRYFFHCPVCGKRALKLYGVRRFLCRTCQNLTYESSQERGGILQTLFRDAGLVAIYEQLFEGVKITPHTAQKLMDETLRGEGTTDKSLYVKLMRKSRKAQRTTAFHKHGQRKRVPR